MNAIPAHKTDDSALIVTPENLPAVFAGPSADVSSRYKHIPTNEFIPIAKEAGWELFNAGMKKRNRRSLAKNPNAQETARHFLAFRPSDAWLTERGMIEKLRFNGGIGYISNAVPRLVVYNSHDRTGSLEAVLGIFEFICSNAAIFCSSEWGKYKIRHMNINPRKVFENFFVSILEGACHVLDIRDTMQQIEVTENQALEFADNVIDLRWSKEENTWKVDPRDLISCHHTEQNKLTAYNVFNRVQENMIQGGFHAVRQQPGKQNPRRKQTKIKDFNKDLDINSKLWSAAVDWLAGMGKQLPPPPKIDLDLK